MRTPVLPDWFDVLIVPSLLPFERDRFRPAPVIREATGLHAYGVAKPVQAGPPPLIDIVDDFDPVRRDRRVLQKYAIQLL
jgi:hypothetical protein